MYLCSIADCHEAVDYLFQIERVVESIIQSETKPFNVAVKSHPSSYGGMKERKLFHVDCIGMLVLSCLKHCTLILHAYPCHRFHPYVELFIRHVTARHLEHFLLLPCRFDDENAAQYGVLNELVEAIRAEGRSKRFQRKLERTDRSVSGNTDSLMAYIDALYLNHARLVVCRIDLQYKKEHCPKTLSEVYEKYLEAKDDLEHLLNNARCNSGMMKITRNLSNCH